MAPALAWVNPTIKPPMDPSVHARAGATVEVRRGRVVSSSILLEQDPHTWATGSPVEWCDAVVDPTTVRLETGGDTQLTGALLAALHERLFGAPAP